MNQFDLVFEDIESNSFYEKRLHKNMNTVNQSTICNKNTHTPQLWELQKPLLQFAIATTTAVCIHARTADTHLNYI